MSDSPDKSLEAVELLLVNAAISEELKQYLFELREELVRELILRKSAQSALRS